MQCNCEFNTRYNMNLVVNFLVAGWGFLPNSTGCTRQAHRVGTLIEIPSNLHEFSCRCSATTAADIPILSPATPDTDERKLAAIACAWRTDTAARKSAVITLKQEPRERPSRDDVRRLPSIPIFPKPTYLMLTAATHVRLTEAKERSRTVT